MDQTIRRPVRVDRKLKDALLDRYFSKPEESISDVFQQIDSEGKDVAYQFRKAAKQRWKAQDRNGNGGMRLERNIDANQITLADVAEYIRDMDQIVDLRMQELGGPGWSREHALMDGKMSSFSEAPVTLQDVIMYGRFMGVSDTNLRRSDMIHMIAEALCAIVPPGWTEHVDKYGTVFYHHAHKNESIWHHPLEPYYRQLCAKFANAPDALSRTTILQDHAALRSALSNAKTSPTDCISCSGIKVGSSDDSRFRL
eukprot:TRINITY_DN7808_c0_g1::TRINITY_DN7808_c0_g1_i1::g.8181::m.8181 TRINITY_DN7808_c0_g1::TRINITY_DN7808_c0_g1_i1::g.8181  ORF type:complete len:255 (-),score=9.37,WW/PF00397.21/4.7e+03,WW/PF00397.21/5.3e-06 TRINITY_DN7808_c0_g1_i1:47-811(-)